MQYWNEFVLYFQTALPGLLTEQALLQGLIIVVLFGLFLRQATLLGTAPIFAAIAYVAMEVMYPVWVEGREMQVPVFGRELVYRLITLYILLIFPIAAVFAFKTMIGAKYSR